MNTPGIAHVCVWALLPAKTQRWSTLAKPDKPARPANVRGLPFSRRICPEDQPVVMFLLPVRAARVLSAAGEGLTERRPGRSGRPRCHSIWPCGNRRAKWAHLGLDSPKCPPQSRPLCQCTASTARKARLISYSMALTSGSPAMA